ncbi:hypothetical protein MLD38_033954 [Melastoma candidum]|uniref:Uncharacterized protein n=1 Tax=Melastoma candidum TaxID=119954 RepID=A0ACB9MAG8_9MYRT|nr:hypothetical protein MLD38_033954 [Melastoma candidum]
MGKAKTKRCELCRGPAIVYCESDEAHLCWSCDERVHSASSLVTKHTRNLLCHSCQDPTLWFASGRRLSSTISTCDACLRQGKGKAADDSGSSESSTGASHIEGEGRRRAEENQVVPGGSSPRAL